MVFSVYFSAQRTRLKIFIARVGKYFYIYINAYQYTHHVMKDKAK